MAEAAVPVVALVSTPFELPLQPGRPPQKGYARRWLKLPEKLALALEDVEQGKANGVEKLYQTFTGADLAGLPVKHRLAALSEAGLPVG